MTDKEYLGTLSLIISLAAGALYIWSLATRRSKPHAFSWGIWAALTGMAYFAQREEGAGPGAWVTALTAVFCLCVTVWALFRGEKNITRSDWLALAGAVAVLPVWYITRDPLAAIVLVVIIDGLGFWPTFRKSWHHPREEMLSTYALSAVKFAVALFAMDTYSAATVIYPLFIFVSNAGFIAMACWRRHVLAMNA